MTESIIEKINSSAPSLVEEDLDGWIIPELMTFYQNKIDNKAIVAYGSQTRDEDTTPVAVLAFREQAKSELRTAAYTFLFKAQHWKSGRDINPYLMTSLTRLTDRVHYDNESAKKANLPVCPLCREENKREFLSQEDKLWRCAGCTAKFDQLSEEIRIFREQEINPAKLSILNSKANLYKIFSLHSRKGYKCLDCGKFIPESINTANGICCPYDCTFFGSISELEAMSHPVALTQRYMVSLQTPFIHKGDISELTLQDSFESDVIQADVQIGVQEKNKIEYDTLMQVINDQISLIKRMNSPGTMFQKILMYEAYKTMLEKYPEDTISYLVHQKQNLDFPIQSRIFQEYCGLIENFLPFSIKKKNQTIDIVDLTDPNLSLFLGISKFDAVVRSDHTIPNNTVETYTGGRKFKSYGPCFIGKLIDVVDKNNQSSLISYVKEYSFISIKLDANILPGTEVNVVHFRIPSHYEMGNLVFLQRIRKSLVDSVYQRLNKKKRIPKGKK